MDGRVVVEPADDFEEFRLGRFLRKHDLFRVDTEFGAFFHFRVHINLRRRIVAHEDDRESGDGSILFGDICNFRSGFAVDRFCDGFAVDQV